MGLFSTTVPLSAAQLNALGLYAEKTADQSVTSSTVLVNDTHLAVTIPTTGTYLVDVWLYGVSAANNAGHARVGFSFPTGTLHYGINGPISGLASGTSGSGDWSAAVPATSGAAAGVFGLSTNAVMEYIHGRFTATATGTFQFMWAQSVSNANASTLKAGSHMLLRQVA
jgi:hypothetical protein